MKILVLTPLFSNSGVPLAQLRLAQWLTMRGHDVLFAYGNELIEFNNKNNNGFKVLNLKIRSIKYGLFKIYKIISEFKPKIIFSAEDHLNETGVHTDHNVNMEVMFMKGNKF
jgi:hypothetical protein